jgi:hypothetical protein
MNMQQQNDMGQSATSQAPSSPSLSTSLNDINLKIEIQLIPPVISKPIGMNNLRASSNSSITSTLLAVLLLQFGDGEVTSNIIGTLIVGVLASIAFIMYAFTGTKSPTKDHAGMVHQSIMIASATTLSPTLALTKCGKLRYNIVSLLMDQKVLFIKLVYH